MVNDLEKKLEGYIVVRNVQYDFSEKSHLEFVGFIMPLKAFRAMNMKELSESTLTTDDGSKEGNPSRHPGIKTTFTCLIKGRGIRHLSNKITRIRNPRMAY